MFKNVLMHKIYLENKIAYIKKHLYTPMPLFTGKIPHY